MLERDLNKITLQLYWNHTHSRMRPRKLAAHAQNNLLQENTSGGLFLYVKRVLKDLNYKKFLFTVVKKKLFTHKIRLLFRFFHSSYFTSRFYIKYFFRKLAQFFSSCLFICYLFKYCKSRVERFSKAKSIFKHVFLSVEGIVLSFNFDLNMVPFTLQSVKWSMVERMPPKIHEHRKKYLH